MSGELSQRTTSIQMSDELDEHKSELKCSVNKAEWLI